MQTIRNVLVRAVVWVACSAVLGATALGATESGGAALGDLQHLEVTETGADLHTTTGALLRISMLGTNLFRLEAGRQGTLSGEGSGKAPIVIDDEPREVHFEVDQGEESARLTTSDFELVIHPAPLRFELRRAPDGELLWKELKPLSMTEQATVQTLSSRSDEAFVGGGQQNGAFHFKGRSMEISYSGGWEEGDRPSPAPFYMSSNGYGVLRNTWSEGSYDFRSDEYLSTRHSEDRFDAYFMVGSSIRDVLDVYTRLTGRAGLLARWAFGYGDADCYNDGDNEKKPGTVPPGWSDGPTGTTSDVVRSLAEKYREHRMPGSWILPNDGYGCGYEDLPEVVERLAELGFRTGLWTEDGVEKIAWEVGEAGSRVQKLDVAWTGKGSQWAMDANHDAAQGFLDNSDARPFIWTVMGWAGIQRYAVTWTGDQSGSWDYIRWHVPTLIGSGLSGMNYSTGDVDGIFGGSPETYTRDLQWKALTPVLMGMSGWSKAARKHPWWFEEPHRSIHRSYLELRMRLTPYLYNLARETETRGAPMVRGLMWDHEDDPHAWTGEYPYQFFLGRELLVAPVYRSQATSKGWREGVYLPRGRWIDFWDGRVIDAGDEGLEIAIPVDLETLPILVRAGAIIPMYPVALYDGQVPADPLTLEIYPFGDSELRLFEDDGETRAYRDGSFSEQLFEVQAPQEESGPIEVSIHPAHGEFDGRFETRSFELVIRGRAPAGRVRLDGEDLPRIEDSADWEASKKGFRYDAEDRGGATRVSIGEVSTRVMHRIEIEPLSGAEAPVASSYPEPPPRQDFLDSDSIQVVGRPAEEPGHALENAFDGDPDTWFRTIRDQSFAIGPHQLTLYLGDRRVIEGLTFLPRNDKHWRYGQVRELEVYLADVNGQWGDAIARLELEKLEGEQDVRFPPRAGRLLRLRVLSTHDGGDDPMVLGAQGERVEDFDALAPVKVGPITISELRILEHRTSGRQEIIHRLSAEAETPRAPLRIDGLEFERFSSASEALTFELSGDWQRLKAEVGVAEASQGEVQCQVLGDGRLIWRSATLNASMPPSKPTLDIRGISHLSLVCESISGSPDAFWIDPRLEGFEGDEALPST
ncbi:MAG: NPCBM/NEW2 domain-containing protein [Thermoanaerobaculia bacterium]|nr:NPCBM/NEW2 domain-containing protein [Thermoanaerobaculia bacterium]